MLNGGVIFFSSCRSVRDLDDLLFGRSRRRQPLAESLHRAADDRLGEFGVVARHVGVRVPENLGQHVDRIPYSTAMQAKVWRAQWVVSTLSMPHTAAISFM